MFPNASGSVYVLDMNRPLYRPAAFLLDLDGVLVDSAEVHLAAYREAFGSHGLTFPDQAGRLVLAGAARERVLLATSVPSELAEVLAEAKEAAVLRAIERQSLLPSKATLGFLERLAEARCPVALVSNSMTARVWTQAAGLEWAFGAIIDGELAPAPKPAPDGFRLAAKLLHVLPEHSVAVDDSPIGVEAAGRAGAFVVGVGEHVQAEYVDFTVAGLDEIPLDDWLALAKRPGNSLS